MRFWRRARPEQTSAVDQRPPLYLHAGLHKTGTTALQMALHTHAARLKTAGFLYPTSGIPEGSDGHHNLAWEMARDRRFRAGVGTIDDAAREIAAHGGPAILSSEDFETMLDRPEEFDAIADHPLLAGHRLVLVVYLREQSAYFRSLFLELTVHGLTAEMATLAETVRERGCFDLHEWRFQFDYHRVATRLAAWRGGSLILRNHHALAGGSTVTDFLDLVRPGITLPEEDSVRFVHAERPLAEAVADFFMARLAAPLNEAQREAIAAACSSAGHAKPDLSLALQARLQSAFSSSNHKLAQSAGLSLTAAASRAGVQRNRLALDGLFTFEMQNRLTALAAN
ncbi:MAG TPA: hypothetical protein VL752_07320 [Acidisoma sp.]|uniref:hypothetical protein n=1 Tax=Acidisoma sp. TaxID=1872115 RepID=UPI002CDFAFDD|nr:hypothetical protein [Acidisoma sp.]HTI00739.1 hypothetical protein [Acidisoma sp.]